MARFSIVLAIGVVVVLFSVGNDEAVRLVFVGFTFPAVGLAFVALAAVVVGAIGAAVLLGPDAIRSHQRAVGLERDLVVARKGLADSQLASLQRLPAAPIETSEVPTTSA